MFRDTPILNIGSSGITFLGWLLALLVSLQHRPLLTLQSLLVLQVSPENIKINIIERITRSLDKESLF